MFDKLIDFLLETLDKVLPFFIVNQYDEADDFEIGDKVKLSNKALNTFNGSYRDLVSKKVYQVISIEDGCRLKLHCGTMLMKDEAVKVDRKTPLFI